MYFYVFSNFTKYRDPHRGILHEHKQKIMKNGQL